MSDFDAAIASLRDGDWEPFAILTHRRARQTLWNFSGTNPEDVAQSLLLKFLLGSKDPESLRHQAGLDATIKNEALDLLRAKNHRAESKVMSESELADGAMEMAVAENDLMDATVISQTSEAAAIRSWLLADEALVLRATEALRTYDHGLFGQYVRRVLVDEISKQAFEAEADGCKDLNSKMKTWGLHAQSTVKQVAGNPVETTLGVLSNSLTEHEKAIFYRATIGIFCELVVYGVLDCET